MRRLLATAALAFLALAAAPAVHAAQDAPRVVLDTSLGSIVLELDPVRAPRTTANFLDYVEGGFYDGTVFHRVIDGFMIQGGGFSAQLERRPAGEPIRNEADNGLRNVRGSVAMARTRDPHSATSQFFINVADNAFLDHTAPTARGWGYAVFGRVVEGMEVVERIEAVATGARGGHRDVPLEPVVIRSARIQGQ